MRSGLNSRAFSVLTYIILATTAAVAIYMMLVDRWWATAALGGLVVLAIIFIAQRDKLPSVFTLLFVLAGLINAAGYVYNLWKTPLLFDEFVHFYTSFTIMLAIGWRMFSRSSINAVGHPGHFVLSITALGVALGVLWEIFEWVIGIIGSPADTMNDLVMDTIGALVAGLLCTWIAKRHRARENCRVASIGGAMTLKTRL